MKINEKTTVLVSELEYIIGCSCYNPKSYDGYTGIEGKHFRYPLNYIDEDESGKTRDKLSNIYSEIDKQLINSMNYKFGSNELLIGQAIMKVIAFLENRYNLDFNELEDSIND